MRSLSGDENSEESDDEFTVAPIFEDDDDEIFPDTDDIEQQEEPL